MRDSTILNQSITASSYQYHETWDREPHFARSNYSDRFWANDERDFKEPWIQVCLGPSYVVKGLEFKWHTGDSGKYWAENIRVKVGMSAECMEFIKDEHGQPKVRFINNVI